MFYLKHPYHIWCRQKDLNILEFLEPVCFKYHFPLSALFCLLLFCASQSLREVYEENNSHSVAAWATFLVAGQQLSVIMTHMFLSGMAYVCTVTD